MRPLPVGVQAATKEDAERSDRELARLFIEMFDVIGEQVVRKFCLVFGWHEWGDEEGTGN